MPTVKVGDINIRYRIHGEGDPLVLIGGLGGDLRAWGAHVPVLSREHQVVVFDNRGGGRTDAPDIPYSTKMMADDTVGLLDALEIDRAHILGTSMGGMIAQELAIAYPQRVRTLILVTTTASIRPTMAFVLDVRDRMARDGVSQETLIRYTMPWMYTDRFFENTEQVQAMVDMMLANPNAQPDYAYARQSDASNRHDTRDRIGQITAPTLVLVGREDIIQPVKTCEEFAKGIPNAELVVLEGGGHALAGGVPDKFDGAVLDFLKRHRRTT